MDIIPRVSETVAGSRVGHFLVEGELGRGGMGIVYDARDERLGRKVALKVLPAAFAADPMRRERFLREARAAAKLSHGAVATVYEIGESDDRLFIAMERVQGRTLREVLDQGPLPLERAFDVARQVASALARAHELGIVHRDLKPDNVMLTDAGEVKILDFGIAKALGADDTGAGSFTTIEGHVLGTPGYMAPEQAQGKKCDARVDVFAFGVLVYELLTGRAAFKGDTPMERVASVLRDEPPPLEPGATESPEELRTLVKACLAKDPNGRPANGAALLAALRVASAPTHTVVRAGRSEVDPMAKTITASAADLAREAERASAERTIEAREPPPPPVASPWPRRLMGGALVAAVLAAGVVVGYRLTPDRKNHVSHVERLAGERGRGEAGLPPVWECEGLPNPSPEERCPRDAVAWCNPAHHRIACCARGLVPSDRDGACGCPPGGAPLDAPAAATCRKVEGPGGLPPEAIHEVFRRAHPELRACIERALGPRPEPRGRVVLALRVSPDGRVFSTQIKESSLPNNAAETCLLDAARGLHFPAIPGGRGLELVHPVEPEGE